MAIGLLGSLMLSSCSGSADTGASTATDPVSSSTTATTPRVSASSSQPTKPPPPPPQQAECRDLTFADIALFSDSTKPTPCSQPHTSYTFAVQQLPAEVSFDGVQTSNHSVQSAAAERCHSAYVSFIGGNAETRALSRLTVTYFLSNQEGFDLGAHWIRCDIVALKSATSLAELPARLQRILDSSSALATYGVCSDGQPSASGSKLVMCTEKHTYRALAVIRLGPKGAAYPGKGPARDAGRQRCQDLVAHDLGVSGGFTYSWTYPSESDWTAGQRFGYCWNETQS